MPHAHANALKVQPPQHPVFGTRLAEAPQPLWDVCCTPATREPVAPTTAKRAKLSELDPNIHCSIVGTCLTTAELRRLIPRYAPQLDRKQATDLQIHHTAVELSTDGGAVAKELNKALDTRHALSIRKFRGANDERALHLLWQEALANGDVPGAYWALMTHPASTFEVRSLAFGDVHMLSHLVGASNRADIRRLVELEEQCERLKEHNARQQSRLNEMGARQTAVVGALEQRLDDLTSQLQRQARLPPDHAAQELAQLRAALADRDQKLALHTARRNEAEQRLLAEQERNEILQASARQAGDEADTARLELRVLEQALMQAMEGDAVAAALPPLDGKCVLYVGGRPASTATLSKLVAAAGGELLVHDGGVEDRRGLLATMLPRAQLVVFPVDFISHNAMHVTKQTCARHGIDCHPIRSASIASFVELMQRLHR
ncbi:DUF2325 domain-containing protein [Duganella aceris]|uniref:DUF2325 domain-containing protein n=1 Tax=Duganella aceris TaxID=2703883 RepID=A0ABX0FPD6_9BURK|nr:DUF2325 domain-containing protein [Duganella aceris]NGZ86478.1 DUF2325 domain-containing protein [Duganella aceris]